MTDVLLKTEDFTVAVKPVGLLSELAQKDSFPLLLAEELHLPKEKILPVHRLDQAVSGVMVYAFAPAVATALGKEGNLQKTYLAVVKHKPAEPSGTYTDFLLKDSRTNKTFVVKSERKGVKQATLQYELLAYDGATDHSLLAVRLETGRSHQIRAQLSAHKTPIVGDGKYGGGDNRASSPALFASALAFRFEEKQYAFRVAPALCYPWDLFAGVLSSWEKQN